MIFTFIISYLFYANAMFIFICLECYNVLQDITPFVPQAQALKAGTNRLNRGRYIRIRGWSWMAGLSKSSPEFRFLQVPMFITVAKYLGLLAQGSIGCTNARSEWADRII